MNRIPLYFSFFMLSACQAVNGPEIYTLGEPVSISYGQEIQFTGENLALKFQDVLGDSRCPSGPLIHCVWAGNAEISIQLNDQIISLNSYSEPKTRTVSGYQVTLQTVEPYPTSMDEQSIDKEDYSIKVQVDRE